MEQIKKDNYLKENPGGKFPEYDHLDDKQCADIRSTLYRKLGIAPSVDTLELVHEVARLGEIYQDIGCCEENFDLKKALLSFGVDSPEHVYVNWYRFDDIDRIRFLDLVGNFDDIWYPEVDDIDVFDESLGWLLSVTHYGQLKLLRI